MNRGLGPRPAAVIFDADGVLFDSEGLSLRAFRETCREWGIELTGEELDAAVGLTSEQLARDYSRRYNVAIDPPDFVRRKQARYEETCLREGGPAAFPGVVDFLGLLHRQGIPHAIGSSGGHDKIRWNLARSGVPGTFGAIVSGVDVARSKPAPDTFLEAARRLGAVPAACVVVEDSLNGLRAARAAGCLAIGIASSFPGERLVPESDLVFGCFSEFAAAASDAWELR